MSWLKNRGIAFKLSVSILAGTAALFIATSAYMSHFVGGIVERYIEYTAENRAAITVARIDKVLGMVQKVPTDLAAMVQSRRCSRAEISSLLREVVAANQELFGCAIAYEPFAFSSESRNFAPYAYRDKRGVELTRLEGDNYRYHYQDWYQIPRELEQPIWSEPYYDEEGGNCLMATYSVPFFDTIQGRREVAGVVTADIALSWLQEAVPAINIFGSGYAFLISANGTFVTHPRTELVMNETIFSVAEARNDSTLRAIGRDMVRGGSGTVPFRSLVTGKDCWMVYLPVGADGWSLAALFPKAELLADLRTLGHFMWGMSIVTVVALLVIIAAVARTITRPLGALTGAAETIAQGDLESPIPASKGGDEVGRLAAAFTHMKDSLREHIARLTETTAAKERIESELRVAHDIQASMLPRTFPPFPDREEFDLYASLETAKEVGGDFYDFFFVDNDTLCLCIGDVSDKGVPASLFMAVTRTLIKSRAVPGASAGEVLAMVNDDLRAENEATMFVTVFCAMLHIPTGELTYANGGHNPPMLCRDGSSFDFVDMPPGMALGVMPGVSYETRSVRLAPADTVVLYTDGINEALNGKAEEFGDTRLVKALDTAAQRGEKDLVTSLIAAVREFCGSTPQSDDMTVVALRYRGG